MWALSETLLKPQDSLEAVNYFSAYAEWLPSASSRHRSYVKALKCVGVTTHISHFKKKTKTCKKCGVSWDSHEEKETDVKLALQILEDASTNSFDKALLVSADSDMVPVIKTVQRLFPEKKNHACNSTKAFRYCQRFKERH